MFAFVLFCFFLILETASGGGWAEGEKERERERDREREGERGNPKQASCPACSPTGALLFSRRCLRQMLARVNNYVKLLF